LLRLLFLAIGIFLKVSANTMPRMPGIVTIFYLQDHKKMRQGEEGERKPSRIRRALLDETRATQSSRKLR
jgi:hypothetical protein